jgi:hypothetical protein
MSSHPQDPIPHQPPPEWNEAPGSTPARRSRKGLWITLSIVGTLAVAGLIVGVVFALSSATRSPQTKGSEPAKTSAAPAPSPAPTETTQPTETTDPSKKYKDAFAERDQFVRDQQLPLDGSALKAVTPKQKEFIARMKSEYAKIGGTWSDQDETIALALTSDACETSILNSHKVDEVTARSHVSTSPLIASLVKQASADKQAAATNGLVKTSVIGTGYMCPADFPQWRAAFDAVNGKW